MNELGLALGWLALQITLVAGLALLLDALLAKRCPRAAARLLTLAALLPALLTAAALCPVPTWWAVAAPARITSASTTEARVESAGSTAPPASGVLWLPELRRLRPAHRQTTVPPAGKLVAIVWLTGVGLSAASLLLGLAQMWRLRRRSQPLNDLGLNELTRYLAAELGLNGRVDLRASDCSGLPATIGFWRPVILLPADWRDWPAADCRAVLAHELAHIRHGDYLSGILALAARALHFYHPLLRHLTARLRLRQELAADALAAPIAGGRDVYVRALARLALRSEGRPTERPAGLLLAARGGALFRRIQMLRFGEEAQPLSRLARRSLFGALVAVAALVSALRGPAQTKPATAPAAAEDTKPFDLTYLAAEASSNTHGVLAVRPNLLFCQPGMEPLRKQYAEMLQAVLAKEKMALPDDIALEDVEQVVSDLNLETKGTGEPGSRSVMLGTSSLMIRLRKDVDWEKTIRAMCPAVKVSARGGRKYFECKLSVLGPVPLVLCAADARTLVMLGNADDKKAPPELPPSGKPRDLGPGWTNVAQSALAIAIDNRDAHFARKFAVDVKDLPAVKALLEGATHLAIGVDLHDGIDGQLFLDGQDGTALRTSFPAVCDLLKKASHQQPPAKPTAQDKAALAVIDEMLTRGKVTVADTHLSAAGHSNVKLVDLIGIGKVEVSESK